MNLATELGHSDDLSFISALGSSSPLLLPHLEIPGYPGGGWTRPWWGQLVAGESRQAWVGPGRSQIGQGLGQEWRGWGKGKSGWG